MFYSYQIFLPVSQTKPVYETTNALLPGWVGPASAGKEMQSSASASWGRTQLSPTHFYVFVFSLSIKV